MYVKQVKIQMILIRVNDAIGGKEIIQTILFYFYKMFSSF